MSMLTNQIMLGSVNYKFYEFRFHLSGKDLTFKHCIGKYFIEVV